MLAGLTALPFNCISFKIKNAPNTFQAALFIQHITLLFTKLLNNNKKKIG